MVENQGRIYMSLPRLAPESTGFSEFHVRAFLREIELRKLELHSFMVLRQGGVVAEGWWHPFREEDPHLLYSLSKSFTSTAVGLAISEGRFGIEDKVVSFFPDDVPSDPSKNLLDLNVKHLLTMSAGRETENPRELFNSSDGNWVRAFLSTEFVHAPGSRFFYDSSATYMLAAILHRVTGQTLLEYLTPRLLEPLGILEATWESCPRGVNVGGWGMSLTTESIAKFGLLLLQKGEWEGRQLVPGCWIEEATSAQISNGTDPESDWAQGYGYQFWRSRFGAFRGDGAFGQYCIVHPGEQMVVAITSSVTDMQAVLNAVWANLLVNRSETSATKPLVLQGPVGKFESPCIQLQNPTGFATDRGRLTFEVREDRVILTISEGDRESTVIAGYGHWTTFEDDAFYFEPLELAGSATWSSENELRMVFKHLKSPTTFSLVCRFEGDSVSVRLEAQNILGRIKGFERVGTVIISDEL
jgi:CubicO group peptidase (beta-lactamase class C family)